ncbi:MULTISPECIES: amino acid ABC transporter permease [Paenibacillus]|uniref:Amino acid ABC transporter permease n=1 Tax=Paenibacillus chitinolyticus TaxID=79263 RepID=A0A410X0J4_9BACL|nr:MULTISPECIES: amino acid ABC transporter permease [Paenibacillus]EGL18913.1 ABC transporter, permease protein [Paenibacillus sp. HGF7]EPD92839.1 His/Glu/Gln/Arg/opine family amino ABC transporter, permease, 3-TM region [Paenibacillus sp. HGH0039]MCY9592835.1 amino acid ABC transporter permease [Paenibacillus chitinolyticus]MCY9595972.1 amino acid ABC transporter permease [Paenibacillus chitinolyticus]QAV19962.1 amino acid ABC transporter permease [Paenibacillus chitinolyticus]
MNFSFLNEYGHYFVDGTKVTLLLSVITVILGAIFGTGMSLLRLSGIWPLRWLATAYIEFFRGTPIIIQIFLVYYALPQFIPDFHFPPFPFLEEYGGEFTAAVITLGLNSTAYVAEIMRAGIQSVDKGQMEAARSLGMKPWMAMRLVVIPQAFRTVLPALGNELVVVIKETSIVSVIGLNELMFNADTVKGSLSLPFEPLIIAAFIYLVITLTLSKLVGMLERRLTKSNA